MVLFSPENLLRKNSRCACNEENRISLKKSYILNPQTIWLTGVYDRQGKQCSLVHETGRILFVDQSPMEILDYSIRSIGFDLKGAMKTARHLLGKASKNPVVVNPVYEIVMFPTHSPKHEDNIWLNPNHIRRTIHSSEKNKTQVTFSNDTNLTIASRLTAFNTQIQSAEQLKRMILEAAGASNFVLL